MKRFHPSSDWRALEACCRPWTWWCNDATALAGYATIMIMMMMMIRTEPVALPRVHDVGVGDGVLGGGEIKEIKEILDRHRHTAVVRAEDRLEQLVDETLQRHLWSPSHDNRSAGRQSINNDLTNCKLHTHTHTQPFNGPLSGTTRVGQYQKKHSPTHTHPDHQTSKASTSSIY